MLSQENRDNIWNIIRRKKKIKIQPLIFLELS